MLRSIQYLRAFAALWVALFHFTPYYMSFGGSQIVPEISAHGASGVLIFFVIAGFVMVWTTKFESDPVSFMWRRLARIFGGYLPIALVFLIYKANTDGIQNHVIEPLDVLGSLTLTNPNDKQILIYPAWTLTLELMFYGAFAICLSFGKRGFAFAALTVVGVVLAIGYSGLLPANRAWIFVDPINITFLIGVAVGAIALGQYKPSLWLTGGVASIFLMAGLLHNPDGSDRYVWMGFGTGFLILTLVRLEQAGRVPKWRLIEGLGDASYAIYLLHVPLIYLMSTGSFAGYILYYGGPQALLGFYLTSLLVGSTLYYRCVEIPIMSFAKKLGGRKPVVS